MSVAAELAALAEGLRSVNSGADVLDVLEQRFRDMGAEYFLVTGLPLPGRPIESLVLRLNWGDVRADRGSAVPLSADDPLIQMGFRSRHPFTWQESEGNDAIDDSKLRTALKGTRARLLGLPICAFLPYQAVVIAAGQNLDMDPRSILVAEYLCKQAFQRLFALGYLKPERPGELSSRERKVVELSASGKTANQIASILDISQRTVHAHLQNASEKLRARNKTHTVVEALRYGQISV